MVITKDEDGYLLWQVPMGVEVWVFEVTGVGGKVFKRIWKTVINDFYLTTVEITKKQAQKLGAGHLKNWETVEIGGNY